MFPISYLVYSVITYLVYNENYHVCLLTTTREIRVENITDIVRQIGAIYETIAHLMIKA